MTAEQLLAAIAVAFKDSTPHVCSACSDYQRATGNRTWKELPDPHIEANADRMPLLDADCFRCYLPAYLGFSVRNPGSAVRDFTESAVCPREDDVDARWSHERFGPLTDAQLSVLYAFQEFIARLRNRPELVSRYRQRLSSIARGGASNR